MSDRTSRDEPPDYWKQADKIDMLHRHEKRLVEYISPSELLNEDINHVIAKSTKADLEDKSFRDFFNKPGMPQTYTLSPLKIPKEQFFREFLNEILQAYEQSTDQRFDYNVNMKTVTLPFAVAEAIMMNQVMMATTKGLGEHQSIPPFTDNRLHDSVLKTKLDLQMKNPYYKKYLEEQEYIKDVNTDMTAMTVLNEMIPSLETVDLTRILEFRDKHEDSLGRFRNEMARLAGQIGHDYWDDGFREKIKGDLAPILKDAINDFKESSRNEANTKFPFRMTAYPSNPAQRAVFVGAGLGALDAFRESHSRVNNGLSILFEIDREFSKGNTVVSWFQRHHPW
jgi:hypothetical protein